MTRDEIRKVFELLAAYYPSAKQLKTPNGQAAWMLVLERFPYEPVKNAVVEYAAKHKFFPDVADITAAIEPERPSAPKPGKLELEAIERIMNWREET